MNLVFLNFCKAAFTLAQVNVILRRLCKGCRPSFCHELNFLKICKGFIHDINVTERKRVKLSNNFTLFFSSYNIL